MDSKHIEPLRLDMVFEFVMLKRYLMVYHTLDLSNRGLAYQLSGYGTATKLVKRYPAIKPKALYELHRYIKDEPRFLSRLKYTLTTETWHDYNEAATFDISLGSGTSCRG